MCFFIIVRKVILQKLYAVNVENISVIIMIFFSNYNDDNYKVVNPCYEELNF